MRFDSSLEEGIPSLLTFFQSQMALPRGHSSQSISMRLEPSPTPTMQSKLQMIEEQSALITPPPELRLRSPIPEPQNNADCGEASRSADDAIRQATQQASQSIQQAQQSASQASRQAEQSASQAIQQFSNQASQSIAAASRSVSSAVSSADQAIASAKSSADSAIARANGSMMTAQSSASVAQVCSNSRRGGYWRYIESCS